MKRFILSLALALLSLGVQAQVEPKSEYRGSTAYWGFQDRTGKWVVPPELQEVQRAQGGFFYVQYDHKWGLYNSRGEMVVPMAYDAITQLHPDLKMAAVKLDGKWGIVDFAGHVIVDYEYTNIKMPSSLGTGFEWWEANDSGGGQEKYKVIYHPEMMAHRDKVLALYAEAEAKEKQEKQAAEERSRKEAELASFTAYAKQYVEPRIDAWQRKDEFETTAEYRERVTGMSRAAMISRYTEEAREQFLREHAELNANATLSLGAYDADNGVYKLSSPVFGDLLLAVPRSEAPAFKQAFASYTMADKQYYVNNDEIGLLAFTMRAPQGPSYAYSNQQALTYNTYEVELGKFDFAPIEIAPVVSESGQSTYQSVQVQAPTASASYAKPTLKILSPANGSSYEGREVVIRYEATSGDGKAPVIEVWINGKPYSVPAQVSKGVKRVGEELPLELPLEPGECYITMQAMDAYGELKMERLTLVYTGAKPKPALNLLAVGVSDYQQPDLKLNQAAKDARDFVQVISGSDLSSYSQLVDPLLLTDAGATEKAIVGSLRQLEMNTNQGDVVMLFFSGHGEKEGNETYFLPVDADSRNLFTTAVDFDLINKAVQRLVSKQCRVVVFMDACYSGSMGSKGVNDDITLANPGVIGFYSSTQDQQSKEPKEGANGVFTKALLAGLQGQAANPEGEITIYRLQSYISDEVKRDTEGKQQPIIQNKLGDMVLFKAKP